MAKGMKNYPNTKVDTKSISEISPKELSQYDGIAFGSPVYFGAMSGEMKSFLDKTLKLWKDKTLEGIPATVFTSAGSGARQDLAVQNIWAVLASHNMIIIPSYLDLEEQGYKLAQLAHALKESPLALPTVPNPVGDYLPYKISGKQIFINQIALTEGLVKTPGTIGDTVTLEEAKEATRQTTLNVLAVLKKAVGGDFKKVKQAVQITGHFKTTSEFKDHSVLMNEASSLIIKALGTRGKHARAAVGSPSLPLNSPTEILAVFEMY